MNSQTKQYRFDFIREMVMQWSPEILEDASPDMIDSLPLKISLPYFVPFETYIPAHDYYGEEIDDYDDYRRQRSAYIKSLYKEIRGMKKHPLWSDIKNWFEKMISYSEFALFRLCER